MTRVVITGVAGFLGRNLRARLATIQGVEVAGFDLGADAAQLTAALGECDVVFHLAGVNRPRDIGEYDAGNRGATAELCAQLTALGRRPKIVFSSSIQAELENPYGVSKREAEKELRRFAAETGAEIRVCRLKNVFGKWSRPNYNSVVATFCHNIANDLPIEISDPQRELELAYVDDVVEAFVAELPGQQAEAGEIPSYTLTLGELAGRIQAYHEMRTTLTLPDFSERFSQQLYATYLSYLPAERLEEQLTSHEDQRGSLAEFIKSANFGQIFVSRTKPGITRGNHYHHTKTEKFFVVEGEAAIRLRQIERTEVVEYHVRGERYQIVNIAPGYTHSIENVGNGELVTVFWASEVFDADRPDTYFEPVLQSGTGMAGARA